MLLREDWISQDEDGEIRTPNAGFGVLPVSCYITPS